MLKRQGYAWVLLILLILGSIGVPLYKHTCFHERITISTIFTPSGHCEVRHEEPPKTGASCCEKDVKETAALDSRCCDEEVSVLKLPLTFFEKIQWVFSLALFVEYLVPDILVLADHYIPLQIAFPSVPDPPPLKTLERLPILCVWRL